MSAWGYGWITDLPALSRWRWPSGLKSKRAQRLAVATLSGVLVVAAITLELRNSWLESLVFRTADRHITYRVTEGPSKAIHYPAAGPYDWSLGYARMPVFLLRLQAAGFHVDAQAEDSKLYSI